MSKKWPVVMVGIVITTIVVVWIYVTFFVLAKNPTRCEIVRDFAVKQLVIDHYTQDQAKQQVPSCEGD